METSPKKDYADQLNEKNDADPTTYNRFPIKDDPHHINEKEDLKQTNVSNNSAINRPNPSKFKICCKKTATFLKNNWV